MKILRIILQILKWFLILCILLFSLATFMGEAYGKTIILWLIVAVMVYFPTSLRNKLSAKKTLAIRILAVVFLIIINATLFKSGPKTTIYRSDEGKAELMQVYDECSKSFPENTEDKYIQTQFGTVHVLACGMTENPPLVMLHAASMGAHSWAENLEPLLSHYRIYAIDNIGEGNKSELTNAGIFPANGEEIADLYATLFDSLHIEKAPVFGASNGGYIAQVFAYHYPEKVESLALFGPMGLTQLSNGSIFMLTVASMYPFQFIRDKVAVWALGTDSYCHEKYGNWFNAIMKHTIPSVAQPVPMTTEQKNQMELPVLLFLGTQDKIVGDSDNAIKKAMDYPNIQVEVYESGHLIATEQREKVNPVVRDFLSNNN